MGRKRLTIEFIRAKFAKEGYTLLTKVYEGNKQKLNYICPNDHKHFIGWDSWQRGQRCPYCAGNGKLTIEFIRTEFAKEGYILLTKIYKNAYQKLEYVCSKGHKHRIIWNSWQQGKRCPYCAIKAQSEKLKKDFNIIKKEFAKEGYILLTKVYKNAFQKLDYICSRGHRHSITWHGWQQGKRCPYCAGLVKLTIEFIRSEFEKEGYTLLTEIYDNNMQKLDYICSRNHKHRVVWANWQQGKRCPTCAIINSMGSGNHNWKGGISCEPYCQDWTKELKELIKERDGYKCLNPYCTAKNPNDLTVHHIDYNKKSCGLENLITVCRSCNCRANFDRDWHRSWYKAILNKRYGYQYGN